MGSNDEDRSVLVSVLAGIGIGVLVGAVAGLLLAPKSGEETRDELSKSLNDLSDKVSDLGRTVGSRVTTAVDRTRAQMTQKLGEISSDGEDLSNSLMADLRSQPDTHELTAPEEARNRIPVAITDVPAALTPVEPEPRPPMLMRAVYPFGLSLRGWRRIIVSGFFVLIFVFFLWRVQAILPPFIASFFLASLLDPIVRYLEKHGRTRVQAILTLFLLGMLIVMLLIALVFPAAKAQLEELSSNFNSYSAFVQQSTDNWMMHHSTTLRFFGIRQNTLSALVSQKSSPIQDKITESLTTLTAILQGIASQAIWLILIPVSTFFFLRDYTTLRARIIALFPARHHHEIDKVSRGIVDVFSAYIQGLAKICSLYGLVVFILLWLLGQRYALFLGLMAGAFYAVPLIGPWIVALTAGLLSYTDPHRLLLFMNVAPNSFACALVVTFSVVAVQIVFDQILYYRVVGGSVGLHPVVSIFALLSGATLFGILGMVIAVPVAGSIQILLTYFFPRIAQPPPAHLLNEPPPII